MAGESLSQDAIKKLLHHEETRPNKKGEWVGPVNRKIIYKAFLERKRQVTFVDGAVYRIRYDGDNLAFVRPLDNYKFVPCGWFNIEYLKKVIEAEEVSSG